MKNTIAILAFSTLFAISACKKTDQAKQAHIESNVPAKFSIDSVQVNDSVEVNNFLTVKFASKMLVLPDIKDKALLDSIYFQHKGITDFSRKGLQEFLEKDKNEYFTSIKNDSKGWVADLQRDQTWDSGSFMSFKSHNNDFLHVQYLFSSYEGGAHSNYGFNERVFDLKDNKKLELEDITTIPKAELENLLKKNIDKIPSGTTDSQGQIKNSDMLLVDVIPANDNFYFDEKNLYFHYSPYEIAAFAAGDIIIPVSWDELKGTLNPQFKERIKIK